MVIHAFKKGESCKPRKFNSICKTAGKGIREKKPNTSGTNCLTKHATILCGILYIFLCTVHEVVQPFIFQLLYQEKPIHFLSPLSNASNSCRKCTSNVRLIVFSHFTTLNHHHFTLSPPIWLNVTNISRKVLPCRDANTEASK